MVNKIEKLRTAIASDDWREWKQAIPILGDLLRNPGDISISEASEVIERFCHPKTKWEVKLEMARSVVRLPTTWAAMVIGHLRKDANQYVRQAAKRSQRLLDQKSISEESEYPPPKEAEELVATLIKLGGNEAAKQGRAFGVGCILATQNPGDIDYKGLSNCATWIVGKLQTKRDRDKVREGLTDAEFSPSDLAKKIARPKTGEFMLLNKEGDVHFIKERWLLTYHCTMSPAQLRRYKAKGLAPYEGSLNTDIAFEDFEETIKSDEQEEIQSLWNDAKDAIGQACNLLEKILDHDINSEKARLWISILRDPDGFNRRLQEAQRQLTEYAEAAPLPRGSKGQEPSSLMTLLSEKKSASQGPSFNDTRTVTSPASAQPPGDSVLVEDDGSVNYKGRTFQLYRRYAGKSVAFIEEDGELKFSIEGKVLSKSFKL